MAAGENKDETNKRGKKHRGAEKIFTRLQIMEKQNLNYKLVCRFCCYVNVDAANQHHVRGPALNAQPEKGKSRGPGRMLTQEKREGKALFIGQRTADFKLYGTYYST